jgi:hypothetical protein
MVPVTLSLALILLTALVLVEARALNIWRDPEDLALVYIFPTLFIAVFFGSSVAVMSSFAGALAAAYFITRRTTAFSLTILDTLSSWDFPAAGDYAELRWSLF